MHQSKTVRYDWALALRSLAIGQTTVTYANTINTLFPLSGFKCYIVIINNNAMVILYFFYKQNWGLITLYSQTDFNKCVTVIRKLRNIINNMLKYDIIMIKTKII